jgi:MFS family permease
MEIIHREPFWRAQFRSTFAAFKYRNYRIWFIGQLISLLGTWMQMTAQGYLVFDLTRSTAYLGYVAFAAGIPPWLFMLYGGVVADRISRRRLMMITQSTMMVLAAILAALTLSSVVQAWHIVVMAFLLGVANAFDAPARQAFVLEMVDREDLTNAIALNSTMFNLATAVGPAAAGVTYALFGPGWCFTINSISFLGVLGALAVMRLTPQQVTERGRSAVAELREGLGFAVTDPHIRILVGLVISMSVFGLSFVTLIPAWAVRILQGDVTTNGFLQSARGIGALTGALIIASLGRFRFRGKLLTAATFLFPGALIVFSFIRVEALSLLVMVVVGIGLIVSLNLCNSLVQTISPDRLRGRIMGIYSLSFFGFMPLGGLLAGIVAEQIGEPLTVGLSAAITLSFAAGVRIFSPKLSQLG